MGLLLDLAVVALAVGVTVSLGLLAWTLGITAAASARRAHGRTLEARRRLERLEGRLTDGSSRLSAASAALRQLAARTARRQGDR